MARTVKRPGTVTWAAVVLFIIGGWSLIMVPCAGVGMAVIAALPEKPLVNGKAAPDDPGAPIRFISREVPGYEIVTFASLGVSFLFGIIEIACGIGVLRLSSGARMLALLVACTRMLFSIAGNLYQALMVMPVQQRFYDQNPHIPGGSIASGLGYVGLGIGFLIQLIIFFAIVGLLMSSSARNAFAAAANPPAEDDEPPRRDEGYDDDYNPPAGSRETGIRE
jgi:hypothetical protein